MNGTKNGTKICLILALTLGLRGAWAVDITAHNKSELMLNEHLPHYEIKADTYQALIRDDGTVEIKSGNTVLMRTISLYLGAQEQHLTPVKLQGDVISLREGTPKVEKNDGTDDTGGDKPTLGGDDPAMPALPGDMPPPSVHGVNPAGDLPGADIKFLPDRVEVTMVNLVKRRPKTMSDIPPVFSVRGYLGETAATVKNLRSGREDVLPASYMASPHEFSQQGFIGHYWPDMAFQYGNGSTLEVRNVTGVDYSGNVPAKGDRGFWAVSDIASNGKLAFNVPAGVVQPLDMVPCFTVRSNVPKSFYFENEPVLYHLDFPRSQLLPGTYELTWQIRDHLTRPVANGTQQIVLTDAPGDMQTIDLTLNVPVMGWFSTKMELKKAGSTHSAVCSRLFDFARIRPEFPEARAQGRWEDLLGERGLRTQASWAALADPVTGAVDWTKVDMDSNGLVAMRPADQSALRGEFAFIGAREEPKKLFEVAPVAPVLEGPKAGLDIEGNNTVDNAGDDLKEKLAPTTATAPSLTPQALRAARVQAAQHDYMVGMARAAAKIGVYQFEPINEPNLEMSPESYIDLLKNECPAIKEGNPDAKIIGAGVCGMDNYPWIRRLFELGAAQYMDSIAVHPYTSFGFQEGFRAQLDATWQILRDYHMDKSKIFLTECGWHRGWGFRTYMEDKYGGWDESHAKHMADLILNAEAMGIPRDHMYIFYTVDHGYNEFYLIGSEFTHENWPRNPAIALQVLNENLRDAKFIREEPMPGPGQHFQVFQDEKRMVCTAFTAGDEDPLTVLTDAPEVTVTDIMGNRKILKPDHGKLNVGMSGDVTYLTVNAPATLRPDYSDLKVQPNVALATLGATASDLAGTAQPWTAINGDWSNFITGLRWMGGMPAGTFPNWLEVKFPKPVSVASVRVCMDYSAWEKPFKDYEIQVSIDNNGQKTWETVATVKNSLNYYSTLQHTFDARTTDRVRILIHDIDTCCFQIDPGMLPKNAILQALEVRTAPQRSAKAFFMAELQKPLALSPGNSTTLAFHVHNITDASLDAQLRVTLPPGMTADKPSQNISLAPNADGSYLVTVKLPDSVDPASGPSVLTPVGGIYASDELISSDYAVRPIKYVPPPQPKPVVVKPTPAAAPLVKSASTKPAQTEAPKDKPALHDALDVLDDNK